MCSTALLSALLAEQNDFKNRCEGLYLENQCVSGLVAEVKDLWETMTNREKADAAAKPSSKGRRKKRVTIADE